LNNITLIILNLPILHDFQNKCLKQDLHLIGDDFNPLLSHLNQINFHTKFNDLLYLRWAIRPVVLITT